MLPFKVISFFLVLLTLSRLGVVKSGHNEFEPYPYSPPDPNYPLTTLKCYSSMTSPDNELICPESRANYCMKEVVDVQEKLCGVTQYFGDTYMEGKCEFRKCSRNCSEEQIEFYYPEHCTERRCRYYRTRYCCSTSLCNTAASSTSWGRFMALAISVFIGIILMLAV